MQPAGAQVRDTIPRRDSTARRDTTARDTTARDSTARRDSIPPKDTIKAALAEAELPVQADPSGGYHWTRATMFERGAVTLQDLLDRTPGLTGFRSNWIAQPITAAYLGDQRRIRLFVDGYELEELDPKMNRVWDLSQIPLWSLDDVLVERAATEIRVHMRSWRVDRTTPFTRTDIYTGDQNTNLYRGLFGRRYGHGEVLQIAGQQFSTTPGRFAESSDQLGLMSRIGIGRRHWTADAVMMRQSRHRGRAFPLTLTDTVPSTESARIDAFLRLAVGRPTSRVWAQVLAGTSSYTYRDPRASGSTTTATDADTSLSRSQYVLTGGYARGALRASVTQRYRVGLNKHVATPSARVGYDAAKLSVTAFAEGRGLDSTRRFDASAIVRPVSFVFLGGSVGTERALVDTAGAPVAPRFTRLEAGVRVRDLWVSAGAVQRDGVELEQSPVVRRSTRQFVDSAARARVYAVRGRVWKAVYIDAFAMHWRDSTGAYRPQWQTRSEVYLNTPWLGHFPSGNFHIRAAIVHEYRSTHFWPDTAGTIRLTGYRILSTQLQFKVVSAELFWTYRNTLNERYVEIPGYRLPRISNIYGVRWEFWN